MTAVPYLRTRRGLEGVNVSIIIDFWLLRFHALLAKGIRNATGGLWAGSEIHRDGDLWLIPPYLRICRSRLSTALRTS